MEDLTSIQGKNAAVWWNRDFYLIETYSGYRLLAYDPQGTQRFLPSDASNELIGAALVDALASSRILSFEEMQAFPKKVQERYATWVNALIQKYGYKNKRKLFQHMDRCGVRLTDGNIRIRPYDHEKLEGWSGQSSNSTIVIPQNSELSDIGAAVRLALSRCE